MQGVNALDDREWAERSRHWGDRSTRRKDKRVWRQPSSDPLILAGHGVSFQIEAGTLLVRNGFTHYQQKQEIYRFFKGDADLPPRISTAAAASCSTCSRGLTRRGRWSRSTGPATRYASSAAIASPRIEIELHGKPKRDRTYSEWSFVTR
jgi:hypothetical protein